MALSVLIVDDNESFLDAARALLQREGMDVVGVASTTAQALGLAAELRPDVVLVDINLGGESGFALARRLDQDEQHASTSILMSTYSEADFEELLAESPAVGFLAKPELSAAAILRILNGDVH